MKIYAVCDAVPEGCDYLTAGKEYLVTDEIDRYGGSIIDNNGAPICISYEASAHLCGDNWHRIERADSGLVVSEDAPYPSKEQQREWYAEWQKLDRPQMFSLEEYSNYAARKACDWQAAKSAEVTKALVDALAKAAGVLNGTDMTKRALTDSLEQAHAALALAKGTQP